MLNRGGVILTLLLLALVSGNVWGQEVSDEFTSKNFKATSSGYADFSDVSSNSGALYAGNSATTDSAIQLRYDKDKPSGIVTTKSGGKRVKSVSVVWNQNTKSERILDVYGKTSAYSSAKDLYAKTSEGDNIGSIAFGTPSLEVKGNYTYIGVRSNKGALYLDKLVITWEVGEQTKVSAPIFTPSGGTSFADELTVKVSCPTEGATIYYTTDSTEPSASSEVFPADGLRLTQTTTLKAFAKKEGLEDSEVTTATYTKIEPYAGIKALKEAGIATNVGAECMVKLTDAVVTYADSKKAYIQDESAGLYVYGSNTLKAGTKLNGVVSAKLASYNGLYELKVGGGEFDGLQVTEGSVEIPVQEVTVAELNQDLAKYESMRVKVAGATVTSGFNNRNGEIEQNGEKIVLRAADANIKMDVHATVDVTGYPGMYNFDKQLNVVQQQDIEEKTAGKTRATLTFEQDAYSVNLGGTITIKATTNSTSPVTYSSGDESIATVDESTGEVHATQKAGTVTITAKVEGNDNFTEATATCTVNVVDPSAEPEARAIVAEMTGKHYAMLSTNKINNKKLDAVEVDVVNNKVVKTSEAVDYEFYIDESGGTIKTPSGQYVTHEGDKTNLGLETKKFTWSKKETLWHSSSHDDRVLGLGISNEKEVFGTYSKSTLKYSATDWPIVDGYARSVVSGDYGTICLPYAVAAEDMSGAEFFSIAGKVMNDGKPQSIVLEQVTTLEAGVPYIFSATSDKLVVAYNGEAVSVAGTANGLTGSFEGQVVAEGKYLISDQNKVQLCGSGCNISENRAYIDLDKVSEYSAEVGVNQRQISLEDATGISATMVEDGLADVYTLSGVEVRHQVKESEATQGLPQGVYIVDGKKVVVK